MAEQNPIKYSDLISPDDSIEKLIKQLEQLQSIYNGVAQSVKDNAAAMAASLRQVSGATEQGRQSTRGASQEADRLTKAYEALNFARSETAHKIAELKEQQKQEQQITKLQVQLNNASAGSYNALSAQYRLNKIALNNLTAEERENLPYAKQLEEETKKIYDEMNRLQQATGKYSLNVGNYENAITSALGTQNKWFQGLQQMGALFEGGFTNGVKQAGSAVAGFGKQLLALLANPIVAVIAAIAAAFVALSKGISSSEENTNALNRILAPFKRIMEGVLSVLQSMAGFVLKVVEGYERFAMGLSRMLEKLPLVGNQLKKVNDALARSIELEREKQLLEKADREKDVTNARLQRQVALEKVLANSTKDKKKQAEHLRNAEKYETQILKNNLAIDRKRVELAVEEASHTQNTAEANRNIANLKAQMYRSETEYLNHIAGIRKKLTKLENTEVKGGAGKSAKDELKQKYEEEMRLLEEKHKREQDAIRQNQDTRVELIQNSYDKEYVKTELQYDRQITELKEQMSKLADDEVTAKEQINDTIIKLEELKWQKLAEIRQREMDKAVSDEQKDYEKRIRATDDLIKKQKAAEQQRVKEQEENRKKIQEGIEETVAYALEAVNHLIDGYVKAAEAKKQLADEEVDRAKTVLDAELEARANGYANEVETARKELDLARKNQQKAIEEQKRAQRAQEAIDTATQTSSLITATANLWKSLSSVPYVGTALAIAAIAAMWGSFAAAKIKAHQVAGSSSEEYGEGTVELLQGGSHQSGNDIDLGRKADGTRRRAEGGEYFAVINKRNSRRYRGLIPDVINSLNDGTFAEKYMGAYQGGNVIVNEDRRADLSGLSNDVRLIREQGEREQFLDGNGSTIQTYKNLRRIIRR